MGRLLPWATAAAVAALFWSAAAAPNSALLPPHRGARWISCAQPLHLGVWHPGDAFSYFALKIHVGRQPQRAMLELRAHRDGAVKVDGKVVLPQRGELETWRRPRFVDLAPYLGPGTHELLIVALNRDGNAAIWARSPDLGLATGVSWMGHCGGNDWQPARPAGILPLPEMARAEPDALQGFLSWLPLLAAVFAGAWWARFPGGGDPARLLKGIVGFWAVLGAAGFMKLGTLTGFDQQAHLDYVNHLFVRASLPLATEGWQMFQPPFYYALSAAALHLLHDMLPAETAVRCLRLINVACGAGLAVVCARLLSLWWPKLPELQCAGLLVAGLLPMHLSTFQTLGNEPLCSLLTALTLLSLWRWLDGREPPWRLGAAWGAALLAKVSPILLAPVLVSALWKRRPDMLKAAATAVLACGWYYGWVWLRLGRPFVGGWDASRGHAWWQEPGLRVAEHFLHFGEALRQPVYAGLDSLWDALYSSFWGDGFLMGMTNVRAMPPWRYGLMSAGMWLALLPTALIAIGLWRGSRGSLGAKGRLAAGCVAIYLCAIIWLYVRLPAYSTAKATYLGGLAPLFGALAAAGLDAVPARWRRAVGAGLACWAAAAALAYLPS